MITNVDILIDPYRPNTLEKLNLSPSKVLLKINPKLIIARLSGYGHNPIAPYTLKAGHDINYLAISGLLSMIGNSNGPIIPLNLIADFAGGSLFCIIGILIAIIQRNITNKGQIIDCAMIDGCNYLASFIYKSKAKLNMFQNPLGYNILDGGAPFYNIYQTLDNKYLAVGAIEYKFYCNFIENLIKDDDQNLKEYLLKNHMNQIEWIKMKHHIRKIISQKTQCQWIKIFDNSDSCVTPVLQYDELLSFKHHQVRNFLYKDNVIPSAPRFSNIDNKDHIINAIEAKLHQDTKSVLINNGYSNEKIKYLIQNNIIPSNL